MAGLAFKLWHEEEGQGMVEYALIFILISLLAIISMKNLAVAAGKIYSRAAHRITATYAPARKNNDQVQGAAGGNWLQSGTDTPLPTQNNLANNLPSSGAR